MFRKKILLLIYFFYLNCFVFINCNVDCSSCTIPSSTSNCDNCDLNCKYSIEYTTCIYCPNLVKYYTIVDEDTCKNTCIGDKILGDSNECTYFELDDYYKLGDVYYKDNPSTSISDIECSSKVCKCKNYYFIEKKNGKIIYHCYSSISTFSSNYKYYHYKTKEIYSSGCPDGFQLEKADTISGVIRCSNICIGEEKYKTEIVEGSSLTKENCVDGCDEGEVIYLENGLKKCGTNCPTGTYNNNNGKCVSPEECEFYDNINKKCYDSCKTRSDNLKYHNYGSKECIGGCNEGEYKYESDFICYKKEDCKYIKEPSEGTFQCLLSCSTSEFYDYDSNKCINKCGEGNSLYKYYADNICYPSCKDIPGGIFIYEKHDNDVYQCSNSESICSNYYYTNIDGIKRCVDSTEDCIDKHYLLGKECINTCPGYKLKDTISPETLYRCFNNLEDCLVINDVSYYNINSKQCWKIFPNSPLYYIKATIEGKTEIVTECEKFYYLNSLDSKNYCLESCKEKNLYFFKNDKKCRNNCRDDSTIHYNYYDPITNECLESCENHPTLKFSEQPSSESIQNPCLSKCPDGKYYDYNSYTCISKCGEGDSSNKYYAINSNICYDSCKKIPGGSYIYEIGVSEDNNFKCSNLESDCAYYKTKENGIKECVPQCNSPDIEFGKECVSSCSNCYLYSYKEGSSILSKYYATLEECFNIAGAKYYYVSSKKCWTDSDIIQVDSTGIENLYLKRVEEGKYEVLSDCEKFYYTVSDIKYCTETCKEIGKKFINGNKECKDSCYDYNDSTSYYYYDPTNGECLETCEGRTNLQFAVKNSNENNPKECLNKCPSTMFYDYDSHLCFDKCGVNNVNNKYHAVNGNICYGSCKDIPGGNYIYLIEYSDGSTVSNYKCSNLENDCNLYYTDNNGIKVCVNIGTDCISLSTPLHYKKGKECLSNCDGYYILDKPNSLPNSNLIECFETLEDCFTKGEAKYYNINTKQCWTNSNFPRNNYYIKRSNDGKFEAIQTCENKYYYKDNDINYCIDNCRDHPTKIYFIENDDDNNIECINSCNEGLPLTYFYYEPTNGKCLTTCENNLILKYATKYNNDNIIQPCLSECPNDKFYEYNKFFCIDRCDTSNASGYKYHAINSNICYPSCESIPFGGPYVYEKDYVCYNRESTCENYYKKTNNIVKCEDECNTKLVLGKECVDNCEDYYKLNYENPSSSSDVIQCFSSLEDCILIGGARYYEINSKKCWTEDKIQTLMGTGLFLKRISEGRYEIVDNCENFYYEKNSQNYCVDSCQETEGNMYFKEGNKKCEESCNSFTGYYYYDPTNNECLSSCNGNGRNKLKFSFEGTDSFPQKCLNECPPDSFHNFDSYICVSKCGIDHSNNKHHAINSNICYPSCKQIIGDLYIYEILEDQANSIYKCSNVEDECNLYYSEDGIRKCVSDKEKCFSKTRYYLLGKECLLNCNNYYILDEPSSIPTSPSSFINCYKTLEDCLNINTVKYYNINSKKCWKESSELPSEYYVRKKEDEKYEIVFECEKFYNQADDYKKYCKDTCKEINKYFFDSSKFNFDNFDYKECKESCQITTNDSGTSTTTYYYYDSSNNECLITCKGKTGFEFAYEASNSPQECLSECPEGKYYYENQKIIKDYCDTGHYISSYNSKLCVTSCLSGEKISDGKCVKNCDNNYYLDNNDSKYKCVSDCSTTGYSKIDVRTGECLSNCNSDKYYEYDNLCIPKCSTNNFYIDPNTYDCSNHCPQGRTKFEIFQANPNIFICKESCPSSTKKYSYNDECLNECPEEYNYIGYNDVCLSDCKTDLNGKYYYKVGTSTTTPAYDIYKCTNSCENINGNNLFYTELEPEKCLSACPSNEKYKFYVEGTYKCISQCPKEHPFYNNNPLTNGPYECKSQNICDPDSVFINGECDSSGIQCSAQPKPKYFINSQNICVEKCEADEYLKKHESWSGFYYCISECNKFKFKASDKETDNYECLEKCPKEKPYIGKNNICRGYCDEKDYYHFYLVDTGTDNTDDSSYNIYQCDEKCQKEDYYFQTVDEGNLSNQCYNSCPDNYPYKSKESEIIFFCYKDCLKSEKNKFTLDTQTNKKCLIKCDTDYPNYGEDKKCRNGCDDLPNKIIDYDGKCVAKCDFTTEYKFNDTNKCLSRCTQTKPRYSKGDYKCKEKCIEPEQYYKDGTNECLPENKCSDLFKVIDINTSNNEPTGEIKCVNSYLTKYYYPSDKILLDRCHGNDYAKYDTHECVSNCEFSEDYFYYEPPNSLPSEPTLTYNQNTCVKECPDDKKYINIDTKHCIKFCPSEKKFFVENAEIKQCLNDCPETSPYYTEETNDGKTLYKCKGSCETSYLINEDPNVIAKKCFTTNTCDETVYYSDENDERICYEHCPQDKFIYININEKKCMNQCPEGYYHEKNSKECKLPAQCNTDFADFETRECVNGCGNKKIYVDNTDPTKTIIICLNSCNDINGLVLYLTPYNNCVSICPENFVINSNSDIKTCVCDNFFYIDNDSIWHCYANTVTNCKSNTDSYIIQKYNTKQCLKICDTILSLNGDYCYESSNACEHIDDMNSELEDNRCVCKNKYYINDSDNNKIKCLNKNDVCPEGKNLYIPDKRQCIDSCPTTYYKFYNFCLNRCPRGSTVSGNECTCDKFWHENSEGNYECLNDCLDKYQFYAEETKQCLTKCTDSYYPNFFGNKCYSECNKIAEDLAVNTVKTPISNELYDHICQCDKPWYYDTTTHNKKMVCPAPSETVNDCSNYSSQGFYYMVKDTLECVKECPIDYPYKFNNLCFSSCENSAKKNYLLKVKTVPPSYECQCVNLWFYSDDQDKVKECLDENINECINYNVNYKYEIYKTKQCIKDPDSECPTNLFNFNYKCYEKCPENTTEFIETGHNHECVCDKTTGYWYEYTKHGRIYYECGLKECPLIAIENVQYSRPNLLEKETNKYHKCVNTCKEDDTYKYAFRNLCVKECPVKTKLNIEEDSCEFYDLNDETEINDLEELKNAANIQAKELYIQSGLKSGYELNKYDASLQIYSINKDNTYKNLAIKSNLTYIDLGTCLNKIYDDGNLPDDEEILVTKYDLLYRATLQNSEEGETSENTGENTDDIKSFINPVEYEFFLKSNMTKIDGAICDPYEILISYPISFTKNKFNNYNSGINDNKYKKQFEIGKKLHEKNREIDTFNKDNKVYKDLCLGIEIDGKDLVLEDRYKYLYPNNVTLCESNCTMDSTDFVLERINCKCTYKEIIDFKRVDQDTNDILNDPNFHKTTQSGANAEIIKCLSKFDIKDSIIKNEAFYYCTVIVVVEVCMMATGALFGIKTMTGTIQEMLSGKSINLGFNFDGKAKINNVLSTTNRMLNNPPKKHGEEDDNKNVVLQKNINMDNNLENVLSSKDSNYEINNEKKENNYGINIKSDFINQKKDENTNINKQNNNYNINNNVYDCMKAEFIPQEYNFKFFNKNDKGVLKKIKRSKIPFEVNKDTQILIERKKGIIYEDNYLEGPFYKEQNIIEIIDDMNNKVIKYNENMNEINTNNDIITIKKNINNNEDVKAKKIYISNKINPVKSELITIKKISPLNKNQQNEIVLEDYNQDEEVKKVDDITSIYNLTKKEHTYLRISYEKYISKKHPSILAIFLAEILDKVYLIKIFIFLKKFEIFSVQLALYMFCHLLLLSLLCGFFTVSRIRSIWENTNFPTMNFYLLYGFLSNIIIWIIYKIFSLLLDNQDKIRALVRLNNEEMSKEKNPEKYEEINNEDVIGPKFEKLIKDIKIQTAVFYIVIFILSGFCFIYLVSFFAIYTGTKNKVFKAYYISIIEILLIKLVYGLCLAALRIGGEGNKLKGLYSFVCSLDKYFS